MRTGAAIVAKAWLASDLLGSFPANGYGLYGMAGDVWRSFGHLVFCMRIRLIQG
jgi:hypothetical protein